LWSISTRSKLGASITQHQLAHAYRWKWHLILITVTAYIPNIAINFVQDTIQPSSKVIPRELPVSGTGGTRQDMSLLEDAKIGKIKKYLRNNATPHKRMHQ
jgi:hypothetical protein